MRNITFIAAGVLLVPMAWAPGQMLLSRSIPCAYLPGTTLDITVTLTLEGDGTLTGLGLEETLPPGWTFNALVDGDVPDIYPTTPVNFIEFLWDPPSSPVVFTYRVDVPPGETGQKEVSGKALYRLQGVTGEQQTDITTSPVNINGPLVLSRFTSSEYVEGTTLDITVTLALEGGGALIGLGLEETLPVGWTFNSIVEASPDLSLYPTTPVGFLEFLWDPPSSPVSLTYRVNVPSGETGQKEISGRAVYRLQCITEEQQTGVITTSIGEPPVLHPADLNGDWRIVLGEAIAYLAGWQQGTNPIGHAIRAAYLWQNGEGYVYDAGQAPPMCWVLSP